MIKHCTLLRKTSGSVFLKDIAQTKTLSLLFPNYDLMWDHPTKPAVLLLLDTSANPLQFTQDLSWLSEIKCVQVLPGMLKSFERILRRDLDEVVL